MYLYDKKGSSDILILHFMNNINISCTSCEGNTFCFINILYHVLRSLPLRTHTGEFCSKKTNLLFWPDN